MLEVTIFEGDFPMCGRFAQVESRDEYFDSLGLTPDDILFDPEPIGRYNVAPGTSVLIINHREDGYHFDPVHWGYKPEWWDKPALINARSETASSSRMFKPLWKTGRAIVPASGWFEWMRNGNVKQPYFIHHRDSKPLFFAAIGHVPFDKENAAQGFVIITAESNKGLVDIHDRMPLVLESEAALEWMHTDTSTEDALVLVRNRALPASDFAWHPVTKKVGNVKNQGAELIEEIGHLN